MSIQQNALARLKGEGAMCLLAVDTGAYNTGSARCQYLASRFGLPAHRAALVAGLAFGEARHA